MLFVVAVHFDDGVIEINTHRTVNTGQHRSAFVQTGQQPRGENPEDETDRRELTWSLGEQAARTR